MVRCLSSRRRSRLACNRENSLQSGQTRPRRPKGSNKTPKAHSSIESCPARRGPGPQLISARIVAQDGEDSLLAARPGYTSTPPSYGCVYPLRWGCPSIPVVKVLATSPPSRVSRAARRRRLSRRRRSLSRRRRGGSPCREVSRGVAGCQGRVAACHTAVAVCRAAVAGGSRSVAPPSQSVAPPSQAGRHPSRRRRGLSRGVAG